MFPNRGLLENRFSRPRRLCDRAGSRRGCLLKPHLMIGPDLHFPGHLICALPRTAGTGDAGGSFCRMMRASTAAMCLHPVPPRSPL